MTPQTMYHHLDAETKHARGKFIYICTVTHFFCVKDPRRLNKPKFTHVFQCFLKVGLWILHHDNAPAHSALMRESFRKFYLYAGTCSLIDVFLPRETFSPQKVLTRTPRMCQIPSKRVIQSKHQWPSMQVVEVHGMKLWVARDFSKNFFA